MQIIALDKVILAQLVWRNQYNTITFNHKPCSPTVNGCKVNEEYAMYHHDYPFETTFERAKRLDLIDRFVPVFIAKAQGGIRYEVLGQRALNLWDAWKAIQFNKHNDKRRNKEKTNKV